MLSLVENLFVKKNPLQDLLSSLNAVISTNERNWILTGHVIFKLRYNQIYLLKTTLDILKTIRNNELINNKVSRWSKCLGKNSRTKITGVILFMNILCSKMFKWLEISKYCPSELDLEVQEIVQLIKLWSHCLSLALDGKKTSHF